MPAYDALVVVSFGGPEGPADVLPFLRNVTAGRNVPDSRLAAVAEHYYRFGGVSPINQQCRELVTAIEKDFAAREIDLPVYWGNRNWQPYLSDTVRRMADDGVTRALAFATSAYSSWSSCRQYLDDIDRARSLAGPGAPVIDKIRPYYGQLAFATSFAAAATEAIDTLPADLRDEAVLVFTAHSIPESMAERSGPAGWAYPAQLTEVAERVVKLLPGDRAWRLAYTSRSGPPTQPWLEPDISDRLAELAADGVRAVVAIPIGFVSDHMEVKFDLDVEAAEAADRLGLAFARAATPGSTPRFVSMVADLVREWQDGPPPSPFCTATCCEPAR
jgi:protoporphyrin/coproporphyrin ferrochelatase